MDPLVLALTYVILLTEAQQRLPPVCHSWSHFSLLHLWDLHYVLTQHMHGEKGAAEVTSMLRGAYDWHALTVSLKVLQEMWLRFLRRTIPVPVKVLQATSVLEKRLSSPCPATFPEGHSKDWTQQCWEAVDRLVTHPGLEVPMSVLATAASVNPMYVPGVHSDVEESAPADADLECSSEEDLSEIDGSESPHHLNAKLEVHVTAARDLQCFRNMYRLYLEDRVSGLDDGLAPDIPGWAQCILAREERFTSEPHGSATSRENGLASSMHVPSDSSAAMNTGSSSSSSRMPAALGADRFVSLPSRTYKYGQCSSCGVSRKIHLVKSGQHAGEIWVRCQNFWVRDSNDKPTCWHGHRYLGQAPPSVLAQQQRMRRTLRFQRQHGPQTRA